MRSRSAGNPRGCCDRGPLAEVPVSPPGRADLYKRASKTIYVASYVITDNGLASALAAARSRGVQVSVLLDEAQVRGNRFSLQAMLPIVTRVFTDEFLSLFQKRALKR